MAPLEKFADIIKDASSCAAGLSAILVGADFLPGEEYPAVRAALR
jgi:hypothetical protein